ncbi:Uncharacterised protein [Bacteroides heparinolyticus]|uniref:Uncharacterized protein n=1 Tax=Prevotella heparinolytica TaxID=28113 RepID=A0A449I571_9BACE|nr:Uncharacterised protein [Bacteroides heparinolyticus]
MCRGKKIAGVLDRHLHLRGQTQAFEPTDTSVQADRHKCSSRQTQVFKPTDTSVQADRHKPLSSQIQVPDKS